MGRHTLESTRNLGPADSTSWFTSQRTNHGIMWCTIYNMLQYAIIYDDTVQVFAII